MTRSTGSKLRPVRRSENAHFERHQRPDTNHAVSAASIRNNSVERGKPQVGQEISAAQPGSSSAFEELHRLYSHRLYRTIYSITKNPQDAEDALQDTFLRAYLAIHRFEGRSTIYSWLTRIAVNSALGILRKRRARPEVLFDPNESPGEDSPHFNLKDSASNPEEISRQRQQGIRLFQAIQNLEPGLRTPILMQTMQGCSIEQIGRALTLSTAAVKARLHRARLRLSVEFTLKHSKANTANSHRSCPP